MEYNFRSIEKKWRKRWAEEKPFKVDANSEKPKYYVLDMFPYPSGAGLHVGHPLGYIASDIYSRYKRLKGFNVLHPMGYDAFGLPAEQYDIQTGQHPAITTEKNINRYREQLDKIGFSYDWDREVRTCEPNYYKWTQWIFKQIFNAWYCKNEDKAKPIETLVKHFESEGNANVKAECGEVEIFTSEEWNAKSIIEKEEILLAYRLAYRSETMVNWCPELGTVLANDEIINGFSERGGFPVTKKRINHWCLRISKYAERLLLDLESIDWPEPLKEMQRNWIGRSKGVSVNFKVKGIEKNIEVFTTRPDTIFGTTFLTVAPEYDMLSELTTKDNKEKIKFVSYSNTIKPEIQKIFDKFNVLISPEVVFPIASVKRELASANSGLFTTDLK